MIKITIIVLSLICIPPAINNKNDTKSIILTLTLKIKNWYKLYIQEMFADDYSIEQAVQDKLDLALFEIEKLSDNQIKEGNKVFGKIRAAKRYGKDPMEYSDNDKQKLMIQYLKVMDKEIKGKLSGAFSGQAISRSAALRSSTREFTGVRHMMSPGMIISGGLTLIKYLVSKRKQKREKYEKYLFRQEMAIQDFMNIIKTID